MVNGALTTPSAGARVCYRLVWFCVVLCAIPLHVEAQATGVTTVTPGARYGAGWFKRFFLGSDYRDLWTSPIEVPVLQLQQYGGGLTPVRRGGFGQTASLHFDGADGRRYVFRSVDKDPSRRLAQELQGTFVQSIIQDQISALHPGAALVVAPLLDAAGVLHSTPTLFVMPDDPALGAFRLEFAGTLGLLVENPDEGADQTPGFAGSRLIVGSERAIRDVEASPVNRFDKRGFLKARLLDVFLGDRDRHVGQWRWARFESDSGFIWVPIPEDRDQAFIHQDGLVMWTTRHFFDRKYVVFEEEYPPIESITWNGWDLDRYILTEISHEVWDSIAVDLQHRLTDSVIAHAVDAMPAAFRDQTREAFTDILRARRDGLRDVARRYYLMLSAFAEIRGTDTDEVATISWLTPSSLRVTLRRSARAGQAAPSPHFSRIFVADETKELRLFLHGGDDRVLIEGTGSGITIRVIGGGGRDSMTDSSTSKVYFYDNGDRTVFEPGARTRIDQRTYTPPPSRDPAHRQALDWGHWTRPIPILQYSPDIGVIVGAGIVSDRFGFRSHPYKSKIWFRVAWATSTGFPTVEFDGDFLNIGRGVDANVSVGVSNIQVVRYHGQGNETPVPVRGGFHDVEQVQTTVAPALRIGDPQIRFSLGPVVKYVSTNVEAGTLLAMDRPYGSGSFGQVGLRAEMQYHLMNPSRGLRFVLSGDVQPAVWDVTNTFGSVATSITGFIGDGIRVPQLALRTSGRKVMGPFPYFEAAYLGGGTTLRGYAEQRFAGHTSTLGNAELRVPVGSFPFFVPTKFGVKGLADVGRVYADGEDSNTWHAAFGGGVYFSLLKPDNTFSVTFARSAERTGVYIGAGFIF